MSKFYDEKYSAEESYWGEQPWRSGEILSYYHDWKIELFTEEILDDIKAEPKYKFPLNRMIAREPSA